MIKCLFRARPLQFIVSMKQSIKDQDLLEKKKKIAKFPWSVMVHECQKMARFSESNSLARSFLKFAGDSLVLLGRFIGEIIELWCQLKEGIEGWLKLESFLPFKAGYEVDGVVVLAVWEFWHLRLFTVCWPVVQPVVRTNIFFKPF